MSTSPHIRYIIQQVGKEFATYATISQWIQGALVMVVKSSLVCGLVAWCCTPPATLAQTITGNAAFADYFQQKPGISRRIRQRG